MTDLLDPPALRCSVCGAEQGSAAGLSSHMRSRHPDAEDGEHRNPDAETPTEAPKGTWLSRIWAPKTPKAEKPKAAKPRARRKRVSGTTVLAIPFEQGGRLLEGWKPCTARVLAWESAWGAYVLDEALAGTLPDRVLVQPLARNFERIAMIEAVAGPVALAFAIESRPQILPYVLPEMRRAIRGAAPFMLKAVAKKHEEDERIEEAFRAAYPTAPDGASADQMIDKLLYDIFEPIRAKEEANV